MDILNRIILSAALAASLSSCFSEFDPGIEDKHVLCMNATLIAGEEVRLQLSRTWTWTEDHYTSNDPQPDYTVTDAKVDIYVNGEFAGHMTPKVWEDQFEYGNPFGATIKGFTCDYIPRPGDRVAFRATSSEYGDAEAEVTIPEAVPIEKVEFFPSDVYQYGDVLNLDLDMLVYFTDPGDRTDYYLFDVGANIQGEYTEDEDGMISFKGEYINFWFSNEREPLFTEHVSPLESVVSSTWGYTIFSDRQIGGKQYPLHIRLQSLRFNNSNPDNDPDYNSFIELKLNSISESYYRHVLSVWVANDGIAGSLGSVGLGEAVFANSNVSTGAGVVAAAAPATFCFSPRQFLTDVQ